GLHAVQDLQSARSAHTRVAGAGRPCDLRSGEASHRVQGRDTRILQHSGFLHALSYAAGSLGALRVGHTDTRLRFFDLDRLLLARSDLYRTVTNERRHDHAYRHDSRRWRSSRRVSRTLGTWRHVAAGKRRLQSLWRDHAKGTSVVRQSLRRGPDSGIRQLDSRIRRATGDERHISEALRLLAGRPAGERSVYRRGRSPDALRRDWLLLPGSACFRQQPSHSAGLTVGRVQLQPVAPLARRPIPLRLQFGDADARHWRG